ncbi:exonuclease domain-containing protein [Sphingomonas faeni]|uniref:exonuclease domain-containing protein n=1 Tax=Sphingomonas faeni TaxID=185950 RepID=UPI0020BDF880|nr:exonuclease domain-containing protein [Sphingomonas faeni]MCK8455479.1 exonuclease domain-containing protein [Sphingomonas faeni]
MSDVTHTSAPQNDTPDFVVIDVETACSRVSSICQIGIVGFKNGREIFEYETLLDPRDIFEVFNTRIHGIAEHHVVGQPTFADVHAIVHGHLTGRTTVAHSYFDKGALAAACRVHDRAMIETTWLDSVRVAKRAWPDLESHRLGLLARYLGITHKHHDALSDARAAGWVIVKASEHTGLSLADWLAPPRVAGPAPRAADDGPLKGERVAILGEPRDGKLAHLAAGLGARVMTGVGSSTTLLVVAGREPFGRAVRSSAAFLKAEELRRDGAPLRIVASDALRTMAALRS